MKQARWRAMLISHCIMIVLAIGVRPMAQAQTFSVIHTFTGGADGTKPLTGLTVDRAGNLYGTTYGRFGGGTVYRLRRAGSGWAFELLHQFTGSPDGSGPQGRVRFGLDGALYGTTLAGGIESPCVVQGPGPGCGTIFRLTPRATICTTASCPWIETVLFRFAGYGDGAFPSGDLTFDQQGNMYGTTTQGGIDSCGDPLSSDGCGTVYELSRQGNAWTHTILYAFQGSGDNYADGVGPASSVILDTAGNLYGTTTAGGVGSGVVFELSPSGNDWIQRVLYSFLNGRDGATPWGAPILDRSGNLYGATVAGGSGGGGTVYELTPSNAAWRFNLLYGLPAPGSGNYGPRDPSLTMDAAGNLYGTKAWGGAYGYGSVFKLIPSDNGWIYTSLHDFTCVGDGGLPVSSVLLDSAGNLYGTTSTGGDGNCGSGDGVVWMITPS